MSEQILYIESRRAARMKRVQTAQHVFAAALLAMAGFSHFHDHPLLAIGEIATAALLFAAVFEERRQHASGTAHHHRFASVELVGALMATFEAIAKTRGPHHVSFIILAFTAPLVLVGFAFIDTRVGMKRYIKIDDRGVEMRIRLLWRTLVVWDEIRGYRINADRIDFGGRVLKLRDIADRERAKAWVVDQLERKGIGALPA